MIQPNIPPSSFTPAASAKSAAAKPAAKAVPTNSGPSDAADINFNQPAPSKAESLYAATAAKAAELKESIGEHVPGEVILLTQPGFSLTGEEGSVVSDFGATVLGEFDSPEGSPRALGESFCTLSCWPVSLSKRRSLLCLKIPG